MHRRDILRDRVGKAALEKLFHEVGLSTAGIVERFGTRSGHVIRLMDEYGISRPRRKPRKSNEHPRPNGEAGERP